MQYLKRALLYLGVFGVALLLFAPKRELYFLLEHRWKETGIVLSEERIQEKAIGLQLSDARLSYEGLPLGRIERIEILPLVLYNQLTLRGFHPSESLRRIADIEISHARVRYALWSPTTLFLEANGSLGEIEGRYDLIQKRLRIRWKRKGEIEPLLRYLKKDEKGWYYERTF